MTFFNKIIAKFKFLINIPILTYYSRDVLVDFDENWFKDKRVAIIGGADSILNEKLGDYIDSFDVVVRVNKGVDVIDKQHEYVGKRTDVLFHCLYEDINKGGSPITAERWIQNNVKHIIFSHNFLYSSFASRYFLNFLRKTNRNIQLSQVPRRLFYKNIKAIRPYGPTTGFIAINTIFNCSPKELYLTGITFFKTPHNKSYRNVQFRDIAVLKKQNKHDVDAEYEYIKKLYFNHSIIKPDIILEEIFKTN